MLQQRKTRTRRCFSQGEGEETCHDIVRKAQPKTPSIRKFETIRQGDTLFGFLSNSGKHQHAIASVVLRRWSWLLEWSCLQPKHRVCMIAFEESQSKLQRLANMTISPHFINWVHHQSRNPFTSLAMRDFLVPMVHKKDQIMSSAVRIKGKTSKVL